MSLQADFGFAAESNRLPSERTLRTITLTVAGDPKAQPRPRAFAINGHVRMYDPATAEGWKNCIAAAAAEKVPTVPLDGPLAVNITFWLPRPKHHYRTGAHAGELKEGSPTFHTSKPDMDNLVKAVLDCLTQLRMWNDDSQVSVQSLRKLYCASAPGALIEIKQLMDQP